MKAEEGEGWGGCSSYNMHISALEQKCTSNTCEFRANLRDSALKLDFFVENLKKKPQLGIRGKLLGVENLLERGFFLFHQRENARTTRWWIQRGMLGMAFLCDLI